MARVDLRSLVIKVQVDSAKAKRDLAAIEAGVKATGEAVEQVGKSFRGLERDVTNATNRMAKADQRSSDARFRAAKMLARRLNGSSGVHGSSASMFGFGDMGGFEDREAQFREEKRKALSLQKKRWAFRDKYFGAENESIAAMNRKWKARDKYSGAKNESVARMNRAWAARDKYFDGPKAAKPTAADFFAAQAPAHRRIYTPTGQEFSGSGDFYRQLRSKNALARTAAAARAEERFNKPAGGSGSARGGRLGTQLGGASLSAGFALGGLSYGLGSAATGLVGYGEALGEMTAKTAAFGFEVKNQANVLGITTDEYQELTFAAQKYGVEMMKITDMMVMLSSRSEQAQAGDKSQITNFGLIGLSAKDLKGKSPTQILYAVSAAMKATTDETKRLAAAQRLLGNANAKIMLPLMIAGFKELGQEAHDLGIILSEEDIKASEKFNQQLVVMNTRVDALKNRIAIDLMPALGDWSKVLDHILDVGLIPLAESIDLRILPVIGTFTVGLLGATAGVAGLTAMVLLAMPVFSAFAAGLIALELTTLPLSLLAGLLAGAFLLAVLVAAVELGVMVAWMVALGLAIEDVNVYLRGGESAIGDFFKAFENQDSVLGATARLLKRIVEVMDQLNVGTNIANALWAGLAGILSTVAGEARKVYAMMSLVAGLPIFGGGMTLQQSMDQTTSALGGNLGRSVTRGGMVGGHFMTPQNATAGGGVSNKSSSVVINHGNTSIIANQVANAGVSAAQMQASVAASQNKRSIEGKKVVD